MLFTQRIPPRSFAASSDESGTTLDCGTASLSANEQLTFADADEGPGHTDVTRKEWGYYLTRSCNDYQTRNGWRTAIIRNGAGRTYVVMVALEQMARFDRFLAETGHSVALWVDELK
jgi:hypothetical protein